MELDHFFVAMKSAIEVALDRAGNTDPTEQDIEALFDKLLPLFAPVYGVEVDDTFRPHALRLLLSRIAVRMELGTALTGNAIHQPWVDSLPIEWKCWSEYKNSLFEQGLPEGVIRTIGYDTRRILDLAGNPRSITGWDRRGLVLGHVQSGKTSNYSGLLCRAADAGYKLFIIIAGIHENLRSQTQQRIDAAFIDLAPGDMRPISLTTKDLDFSKDSADHRIPPRGVASSLVLVVKKNASILRNLLNWLKDNSTPGSDWADMPLLLIDDEADNASVNTNKAETDPTRINSLIRSILNTFTRSTYVGYTATPFANIFIDPERNDEMVGQELFPKDFIYCLEAPDNYTGPDTIFGNTDDKANSPYLRKIPGAEDALLPQSHKSSFEPHDIPDSLKEAVRLFILACAVRKASGAGSAHASMLVNVSHIARIQRAIGVLLDDYLDNLKNRILGSAALPGKDPALWEELQDLFEREYGKGTLEWSPIRSLLPDIAREVRVDVINNKSPDRLDYHLYRDTGLKVIAVGGYTLSRGLTLENLIISYWKRNSKAYDTLLQMGRWFGYRAGYDELCRIWMPRSAQRWYTCITGATAELRADLIDMASRGLTPEDFGLKVRNAPETLIITARNKMMAAEKRIVRPDLAGRLIETHIVRNDKEPLQRNRNVAEELVKTLIATQGNGESGALPNRLWRKVSHEFVSNFFHAFDAHKRLLHADTSYIFSWLQPLEDILRKRGQTLDWDVLLVSLATGTPIRFAGLDIIPQERSVGGRIDKTPEGITEPLPWNFDTDDLKDGWRIGNKQRVASRGIEGIPLSEDDRREAEKSARMNHKKGPEAFSGNVPDREYRKLLPRPLLMLHVINLLNKESDGQPSLLQEGVIAWGASFPPYNLEIKAAEYTVNRVWLDQFARDADDEDEED